MSTQWEMLAGIKDGSQSAIQTSSVPTTLPPFIAEEWDSCIIANTCVGFPVLLTCFRALRPCRFTVCPKADAIYPIVSAASIVAKVSQAEPSHAVLGARWSLPAS